MLIRFVTFCEYYFSLYGGLCQPDADLQPFSSISISSRSSSQLLAGASPLLRRVQVLTFLQQIQHVREILPPPPGFLDLEISEDEEFSPDKLRANLERLYMTVVRVSMSFLPCMRSPLLTDCRNGRIRQAHCASSLLERAASNCWLLCGECFVISTSTLEAHLGAP